MQEQIPPLRFVVIVFVIAVAREGGTTQWVKVPT